MEPKLNREVNKTYDTKINPTFEERESWKTMMDHLYSDITLLYEREKLLIRSEMNDKVNEVIKAVGSLAVGGGMLVIGAFAIAATAIIVLDIFMPLWASALIVSAGLLIVGFVMVKGAQKKLAADRLKPRHSIETVGEIKTTFKERYNEFKQHH